MKSEIEKLGLRELDSLIAAAEKRKQVLSNRRPAAVVRKALAAFARSQGYAIHELIDAALAPPPVKGAAKRRKASKVAVKYRDPRNRRNTWSGRGRMPRWLAERTKRGESATDFLVPGLARPTAKKGSPIGRKLVIKANRG